MKHMHDTQAAADLAAQTYSRGVPPTFSRSLLRDDIYAHVKDLIAHGKARTRNPAARRRDHVALGVSRTPVRDAMRRLQDEGFIEAEPRR